MIRYLDIKNFATIEHTSIEFHDGLNIITGETGAGKSVVVEAMSLALGSRADTSYVRTGTDRAEIQMIADLDGEEYIITRQISSSGRNVCRINDEIVTLSHLSSLCEKLADIHGQYDNRALLDPERHIELIDLYRSDIIAPEKENVRALYDEYSALASALTSLMKRIEKDRREQDFMEYELKELRDAALVPGEDSELEEKIDLLQNSENIYESLAGAYDIASESEYPVLSSLKRISDMVSQISSYSHDLEELAERLDSIYYDFEDACSSIRDCRDRAVFSPDELDSCISRLDTITRLKNKHSRSIEELISYQHELETSLSDIVNADEKERELRLRLSECREKLSAACDKLSAARKDAAEDLSARITAELRELNFNDAVFSAEFTKTGSFSENGNDKAEFMISANRGEPLKPLSRIASGGEISRIMLAFKKTTGDYDAVPAMIFDEIDSGISGITASIVGRKLKDISASHQIICITHLPQIAAFGSHNYRIEKDSDDSMTYTHIRALTKNEKIREIARLLGGTNITNTTLRSAEELIDASV